MYALHEGVKNFAPGEEIFRSTGLLVGEGFNGKNGKSCEAFL